MFNRYYYSGNVSLVHKVADALYEVSNSQTNDVGGTMDVDVIGSGDFKITFLLMPFSVKWDT